VKKIEDELLAPCSLYCGVCGIFYADRKDDKKLKQKLANAYWTKSEKIECNGCFSDKRFFFCKKCKIRQCVQERGISGCHLCQEFPCEKIENYPFKLATEYMKISVPARKKSMNDKQWVEWEKNNWKCAACGEINFRGAKKCHNCFQPLMKSI
jgi:hypothetical protein